MYTRRAMFLTFNVIPFDSIRIIYRFDNITATYFTDLTSNYQLHAVTIFQPATFTAEDS